MNSLVSKSLPLRFSWVWYTDRVSIKKPRELIQTWQVAFNTVLSTAATSVTTCPAASACLFFHRFLLRAAQNFPFPTNTAIVDTAICRLHRQRGNESMAGNLTLCDPITERKTLFSCTFHQLACVYTMNFSPILSWKQPHYENLSSQLSLLLKAVSKPI